MARGRSEDKRNAILAAATRIFAERGLAAPTAAISKEAGVGEGTLFVYFPTKDALINSLYRELKMELADAMMSSFPRRTSVKNRLRHVWDHYVIWGNENPLHYKVLKQIEASDVLTEASKTAGMSPFAEIQSMVEDALEQKLLRDLPEPLVKQALLAMAETAMVFSKGDPDEAGKYREAAFEIFWAGVMRAG
jgi:AcrR family transcriptional regulator